MNNKKNVDLSVVIPVYNDQEYIQDTVRSVLHQKTNFCYEIIIIDDGSNDNTFLNIRDVVYNNENVFYYYKENAGAGSARNLGINKSNGEYIYFLDGDDFIYSGLFDNALSLMKKKNLDIYMFSAKSFSTEENIDFNVNYLRSDFIEKSPEIALKEMFRKKEFINSPCLYISRLDNIKKNNLKFPENIVYEDGYFTLFNILNSKGICLSSDFYYARRIRKNSVMGLAKGELSFKSSSEVFFYIADNIQQKKIKSNKLLFNIIFLYFRGAISEYYKMSLSNRKKYKKRYKKIIREARVYINYPVILIWSNLVRIKRTLLSDF